MKSYALPHRCRRRLGRRGRRSAGTPPCSCGAPRKNTANTNPIRSERISSLSPQEPHKIRRRRKEKGGSWDLVVGAGEALADDLALEGAALVDGEVLVVLGQPRLPLLVHEQHEPDPHRLASPRFFLRSVPRLLRLQPLDTLLFLSFSLPSSVWLFLPILVFNTRQPSFRLPFLLFLTVELF